MSNLHYIIPFLVILTVLVFVHELGHYLIARKNGVKVDIFSIGMGKELWGFTDKNKTRWRFSLIPFGGYVMMHGDKDPSSTPSASDIQNMSEEEKQYSLMGKTPMQRIAVSAAGPIANLLFAFVAVFFVYFNFGKPFNTNSIEKVFENTPASVISLKENDKILKIENSIIKKGEDVITALRNAQKKDLEIHYLRDGVIHINKISIDPNVKQIGISFKKEYIKYSLIDSITQSFADTCTMIVNMIYGLCKLFTGGVSFKSFGGPLSIANMSGNISKTGDIGYLIFFAAILSINLGIINLVPFPALDGGNILLDGIEVIIRRPLSLKIRELISTVGMYLLLLLMISATVWDVVKIYFS